MVALSTFPNAEGAAAEADWEILAASLMNSGVIKGRDNELLVSANATGMQVSVATGACAIEGFWAKSTSIQTLAIATADSTNDRIDRVVLHLDRSAPAAEVSIIVLTGTPATTPTAPALTNTSVITEVSIAKVSVEAGVSTIESTDVWDERGFAVVGGNLRIPRRIGYRNAKSDTATEVTITSTPQDIVFMTTSCGAVASGHLVEISYKIWCGRSTNAPTMETYFATYIADGVGGERTLIDDTRWCPSATYPLFAPSVVSSLVHYLDADYHDLHVFVVVSCNSTNTADLLLQNASGYQTSHILVKDLGYSEHQYYEIGG